MSKLKNALLTQVFTVFISSQTFAMDSGLLDFNDAVTQRNYSRVNELSKEVIDSLIPKEGMQALIETNPHSQKVVEMVRLIMNASVAAIKNQNVEKILMCISRLADFTLIQNNFQIIELCKALGVGQEVLELLKTKAMGEMGELTKTEKEKTIQKMREVLSPVYLSVKEITPSLDVSLKFIRENRNRFSHDSKMIFWIDWVSGALNFSLFNQYYANEKYSDASPLLVDVMHFVNFYERAFQAKTMDKMARVIIDQGAYSVEYSGISPQDGDLLQQAVEKIKKVKPVKKKAESSKSLLLTGKELEKADAKARLAADELLKSLKQGKKKRTNPKKENDNSAVFIAEGVSASAFDSLSASNLSTEEFEITAENSMTQESFATEKTLVKTPIEPVSKEEKLLLELLTEREIVIEQKKELAKIKEENRQLKEKIAKLERDKEKGRERGKQRSLSLLWFQKQLKETEKKLEILKSEKRSSRQHVNDSEQDLEEIRQENERLRVLEEAFNNLSQSYSAGVQKAFMDGQAFTYFQLSQRAASVQEFAMEDTSDISERAGIVTQWGEWYPITQNENGVSGFTINGVWYPVL